MFHSSTPCHMQTNPLVFHQTHKGTVLCQTGAAKQRAHNAAVESRRALSYHFFVEWEVLKWVEAFKYLGWLLSMDNVNRLAINTNLLKARKCWSRLLRLLRPNNLSPRVSRMFYKGVEMAVLLYGSESWNITPLTTRRLEGFQNGAAMRMTWEHKPCRQSDGTWTYLLLKDVRAEVGLHTIGHYIGVRRNTVAQYIATRPILELYTEAERRRETQPRQHWWEQPMDLDAAKETWGSEKPHPVVLPWRTDCMGGPSLLGGAISGCACRIPRVWVPKYCGRFRLEPFTVAHFNLIKGKSLRPKRVLPRHWHGLVWVRLFGPVGQVTHTHTPLILSHGK